MFFKPTFAENSDKNRYFLSAIIYIPVPVYSLLVICVWRVRCQMCFCHQNSRLWRPTSVHAVGGNRRCLFGAGGWVDSLPDFFDGSLGTKKERKATQVKV